MIFRTVVRHVEGRRYVAVTRQLRLVKGSFRSFQDAALLQKARLLKARQRVHGARDTTFVRSS